MRIEDDPSVGLNAALAATLNEEREARGFTMDTLSEKSGVSRRTLIRYLQGQRHTPVAVLDAMAKAMNMKASTLLRRAEQRKEES